MMKIKIQSKRNTQCEGLEGSREQEFLSLRSHGVPHTCPCASVCHQLGRWVSLCRVFIKVSLYTCLMKSVTWLNYVSNTAPWKFYSSIVFHLLDFFFYLSAKSALILKLSRGPGRDKGFWSSMPGTGQISDIDIYVYIIPQSIMKYCNNSLLSCSESPFLKIKYAYVYSCSYDIKKENFLYLPTYLQISLANQVFPSWESVTLNGHNYGKVLLSWASDVILQMS